MADPVVTPGKGTVVQLTVVSTLTTIPQIENLTIPGLSQATIDTTGLDNSWKTCIGSIPEGGELSFTLNWNPGNTVHGNVFTASQSATPVAWSIACADAGAAAITFSGVMTKFQPQSVNAEGIVKVDCTLKVSGAITITP